MKRSVLRRSLSATLFATVALGAFAETTQSAFQYKFSDGLVLDFETSATFTSPVEKKDEVHNHKISYTVLAAKDDTVDFFASAKMLTGRFKELPFPIGVALQIDREGKVLKERKGALSLPSVFPGYSANMEIPVIAGVPDGETIDYPDPITGLPLQAKVTKKVMDDTFIQKIDVDRNSKILENLPIKITDLSVENQFSIKEGLPKATHVRFSMVMPIGQNGEKRELALQAESKLKGTQKLSAEALGKLKVDVAAAMTATQALERADKDTTAMLKAIEEYLAKHPGGVLAPMLNQVQKTIREVAERNRIAESIKEGKPAPDFTAETIDGKEITLSKLRGKVVVLDFWATWCAPCKAMIPHLKELYETYRDKGVVLIGISGDNKLEELQGFVEENDIVWPQVFDGDSGTTGVLYKYGVNKFPTIVVVDQQGVIRGVDVRGPDLTSVVDQLLSQGEK